MGRRTPDRFGAARDDGTFRRRAGVARQGQAVRLGATVTSRGSGSARRRRPQGDILAARVPDLGAKEALLADSPEVCFTTPHFNGYSALLVRLNHIAGPELEEMLVEAWLSRAPKRLAATYLADRE